MEEAKYEVSRVQYLKSRLKRGDRRRIAQARGVTDTWVSLVFSERGISEPILQAAEALIADREQSQTTQS